MGSFYSFFFDKKEVKDMDNHFLRAKITKQETLKFHLELNFNNFKERENGKVLD